MWPTNQYQIYYVDASEPAYYGYVNSRGGWYILKAVTSGNVTTYSTARGGSGFSTNWTNRANLTYTTPNPVE